MKLFVVVTCCIGIVAAAVDDDNKDEIESLGVSEGENLTIAIHIKKPDKDPQVLVTRLKDSSQESIAQLICHNGDCEREEKSGVSLIYDGGNVTLILMNVSNKQTGLYKVCKLSDSLLENQIYNVTLYQVPLRTISSSVMYSEFFTAGITSATLVLILVLITGAISVVYWKRRKAAFSQVSQNDDTAGDANDVFVDP